MVQIVPFSQIERLSSTARVDTGSFTNIQDCWLIEMHAPAQAIKECFAALAEAGFDESEEQLRVLSSALGDGGQTFMALNNYGFSRLFTWVGDRYGVSWQLNLP